MRLLFFLLFIGFQGISQTIDLGKIADFKNSSLDTTTNSMYLFFKDYYRTIDLENLSSKNTDLYYDPKLSAVDNPLGHKPFQISNKLYFVQSEGGLVYMIDNDTVKRIDRSFNHNMQYGSAVFTHQNKIFKFGGYGFWSNRDFFTYYDHAASEWEVLQPINSEALPQGLSGTYHIKNGNDIFIFGGRKLDAHNRRHHIVNTELWRFNFEAQTWKYLGDHQSLTEVHKNNIAYKNKLIALEEDYIILIDILNNKKIIFEHSPLTAKLLSWHHIHYSDGKFYVLLFDSSKRILQIVDDKDFFGRKISESKFYKNNKYWLSLFFAYILALIIVILVIWLGSKGYKKSRKIILLDNGLRYKNKFTEFDEESMQIIIMMLKIKQVPSYKILQIVEKEQYSPAHNERLKVQKINDINLKISTLLGNNEDIIQNFKSDEDRRIRVYVISKKYFN